MHFSRKYIIIQVLILLILLWAAEGIVRYMGYVPGDMRPNWSNFHPVDSLIVYHDFVVDSTGILVANREQFKKNGIYINRDGFRTGEFNDLDTARHKTLLIGDSFTWGLSASPIDSCFADIISRQLDGTVINMGIPIADPAQYDAIARRYIQVLRPETVIVMFYLGNDIMLKPRPIVPYRPFYYYTNAGAIMADDGDVHLNSAREAYDYYTQRKFFLLHPKNIFERLIAKSALLSQMYSLKYRWREKQDAEKAISEMSVTQRYLYSIVNTCKQNDCKLKIILIPEIKEAHQHILFFKNRYKGFFADTILSQYTFIPEGISAQYYMPYPDGHLNNAGHRFYANQILEQLSPQKRKDKTP